MNDAKTKAEEDEAYQSWIESINYRPVTGHEVWQASRVAALKEAENKNRLLIESLPLVEGFIKGYLPDGKIKEDILNDFNKRLCGESE